MTARSGFVNLTGNPKMDRLNDAIERVMAEKAAARSLVGAVEPSLFDPLEGPAPVDPLEEIA